MTDLILGCGAIAIGAAGMIWGILKMRSLRDPRRNALAQMSNAELNAEITRCAGAIMTCGRRGDRKGVRHAYRAMRPIMREMLRGRC